MPDIAVSVCTLLGGHGIQWLPSWPRSHLGGGDVVEAASETAPKLAGVIYGSSAVGLA